VLAQPDSLRGWPKVIWDLGVAVQTALEYAWEADPEIQFIALAHSLERFWFNLVWLPQSTVDSRGQPTSGRRETKR
jgi:hypothetical protein